MSVKATLQIVLKANDVVVAESDDAALWQRTLASITGSSGVTLSTPSRDETILSDPRAQTTNAHASSGDRIEWPTGALEAFASDLRLDPVTVQAACDPTTTPPYLHLDLHAWEDFKRNTGERGVHAVPQVVLAAALLLLWLRRSHSGPTTVTTSQAQAVLNTIGLRDKNTTRGLKNCEWLQARDDTIRLNPAKFTQALAVARAFCSHQAIEERQPVGNS